jgi:hypothetical protein
VQAAYLTPDGDLLAVIVLGADAFDTDELSSARASVPADTTVVLYVYIPQ